MDISLLIIITLAIIPALITYLTFAKTRNKITIIIIGLLLVIQITLTIYKGFLDSLVQNNLEDKGVTINWKTGQIIKLTDKSVVTNFNTADTNNSSVVILGRTKLDTLTKPVPDATVGKISILPEIPDENLPASECITDMSPSNYYRGKFRLFNKMSEKILLYQMSNGYAVNCSVLISPNESNLTPLVTAGVINEKADSISGSSQYDLYFKTIDSNPIKYGTISLVAHACKLRTVILTENNLYLSTDSKQ